MSIKCFDEIRLDTIRKNPLDYYMLGDMWLFNFAMLNFEMNVHKVRLNSNQGADETVADWLTAHNVSVVEWFYEHYQDTDYFLPIEI